MPYITLTDLQGLIPGPFLAQALDDDGDGQADPAVLNQVLADASQQVDAALGAKAPFSNPLPAKVVNAAKYFAVEQLYKRRGKPDENPFKDDIKAIRDDLAAVKAGTTTLTAKITPGKPAVTAVTAPAASTVGNKLNA